MAVKQDIDIYLDKCEFPFEVISDDIWRVESPEDNVKNIFLQLADPILYVTIRLFKLPDNGDAALLHKLLKMNATEIPHGAFGIDVDDFVILIDTLELENLDVNELKASIQSIAFTTVQCYKEFGELLKQA